MALGFGRGGNRNIPCKFFAFFPAFNLSFLAESRNTATRTSPTDPGYASEGMFICYLSSYN